ncbi:DNA-binding transcription factor [Lithospermum erythrorhizon]|uniref:DNA-binding transcription factor n=1 Tax=Lithospermum erythrorhizon TaxID=34254 RepID=A0AAV3R3K3_LITER
MMQRFSNNCNENMVGPCYSCGYYHHGGPTNCNSLSMIFSMQNHHHIPPQSYQDVDDNMYEYSSGSPSVDCTLSLGPPSSCYTHDNEKRENKKKDNCMQNFCNWDILQSNNTTSSPSSTHKSHRGGGRSNTNNGGDTLSARRCSNCDTTSTPLWRNGPRGPKSLCNACGIRYKKEERRATAAAATNRGGGEAAVMDTQHIINGSSSWMHHSGYGNNNEFRFIQEDDGDDIDNSGIYVFPLMASQHY